MGLSVGINFEAILDDATDVSSPPEATTGSLGAKATKHNETVTSTDGTFTLDGVTVPSVTRVKNLSEVVVVVAPAAPTITNQGTAGSTSYSYKIVAVQAGGTASPASPAGTTATGNATLNTTNFNRLSWTPVSGADHYDVYRTASAGTPATTGKIGTVDASITTIDDTGLAGDGTTPPSTAVDNVLLIGSASGSYQLMVLPQETWVYRWNGASFATIHRKANTSTINVEIAMCDK